MKKGMYEFNVESGTAGFRYDMIAGVTLEEMEGKDISEILSDLVVMAQHAKEGNLKVRLSLLMNLLHAAAKSYAEFKGIESPSRATVSEWNREIDAAELYIMIFEGMQMFMPKNLNASAKGAISKVHA
jgi:hypothetical protein